MSTRVLLAALVSLNGELAGVLIRHPELPEFAARTGLLGRAAHTARQAASRSAGRPPARDGAFALMLAAAVVAGALPGVLDHRPGAAEPGEVTGLGQDRGSTNRGEPGDRGHQLGKPEFIQDNNHACLSVGQPPGGVLPIGQDQIGALQRTDAMRGDAVRVDQRGEHRPHNPQIRADPVPLWKFTAHRGSEPVHAQAAQPSWVTGRVKSSASRARPTSNGCTHTNGNLRSAWRASHIPDSGPNKVRTGMEDRAVPGHWESDLIIGAKGRSQVLKTEH